MGSAPEGERELEVGERYHSQSHLYLKNPAPLQRDLVYELGSFPTFCTQTTHPIYTWTTIPLLRDSSLLKT